MWRFRCEDSTVTIPLAWHNLWHQPVRSGVAIVGVTFAAVLMFMQLGFLEAVKASATVIYDVLDFDICLRSRDYDRFNDPRSFDRALLAESAHWRAARHLDARRCRQRTHFSGSAIASRCQSRA